MNDKFPAAKAELDALDMALGLLAAPKPEPEIFSSAWWAAQEVEPYTQADMDRDEADALNHGPRGHYPKVRVTRDGTRG